jgi:hypothetical protein
MVSELVKKFAKGSFPYSQEPHTGCYLDPDEYSYPPILFKIHLILSFHIYVSIPGDIFSQESPAKMFYGFLSSPISIKILLP